MCRDDARADPRSDLAGDGRHAAGTWQVQDWRYDGRLAEQAGLHKDDLAAITNAAADQARDETDKRLALEQQLAGQDQQHTRELSDAQRNQGSTARSPCHC